MKKILTFGIMLMFLIPALSSTGVSNPDNIEIRITAGFFGLLKLDIGHGLGIWIYNPNEENVTYFVNMTHNYLFLKYRNYESSDKYTLNSSFGGIMVWYSFQLQIFSITVECKGKSLTREGLWIGNLVILYK